jgi:hypothetical protein
MLLFAKTCKPPSEKFVTRGQTGLRRLLLGSVARNVLLHAPCSVMVVRGGIHTAAPTEERHEDRELVSPAG